MRVAVIELNVIFGWRGFGDLRRRLARVHSVVTSGDGCDARYGVSAVLRAVNNRFGAMMHKCN